MDLSTQYLGLELKNPLVAAASPPSREVGSARKLEDAGYIRCRKFFDDRTPRTEYQLTEEGRQALETYLSQMEDLINQTRA